MFARWETLTNHMGPDSLNITRRLSLLIVVV